MCSRMRWKRTGRRGKANEESWPDNYWFDCLVGCAAAANLAGATLPGVIEARRRKRERVDVGEWQRRAREGR